MKLLITDKQVDSMTLDTVLMSVNEFNDIHTHPFIASSKFDAVVLDLDSKINLEYLSYLVNNTKVIPMYKSELNSYIISVLSIIYRDKSANLRFSFIRDRSACEKYIEKLRQEFEWDLYY